MKISETAYLYSVLNNIEIVFCKGSKRSYPEHNHVSVYTIGFILEGTIEVKKRAKIGYYKKGDFFVIPPYEPHSIIGENLHTLLSICIGKNFIRESDSENTKTVLKQQLEVLVKQDMLVWISDEIVENAVTVLYKQREKGESRVDKRIGSVKESMECFPENEEKLEELSKKVFISKYHFIREFKKQIGLTPHQFQLQNRIRKAQRFLRTGASMTEAAFATGFYDQSHFNKCFKKIVGITPSEYLHSFHMLS